MLFTCTKENLINALQLVTGVTSKQSNLPILSNVLIEVTDSKVELIGTDLEIGVKVHVRAKVEQAGSFTVPAKTFSEFVNLVSDEQVDISLEGNELIIKAGKSRTKIKGSPADEYPVLPEIEEKNHYLIDAIEFKKSISNVVIASAKNDIRPELSGVYFGFFTPRYKGLVLAATDSYRLAEKKLEIKQGDEEFTCIVPGKTVNEIGRIISLIKQEDGETSVRLWVSESQIALRYGHVEMTSRLIDGNYPDYAQIIPSDHKSKALVPVTSLIQKVKAASLFTTIGINAVNIGLNSQQQTLSVSSTSTQTGEHNSELMANVDGEDNAILLNHKYFLDGLQQIHSENVIFTMNSGDTPCMIVPDEDDSFLYIVMPIRQ